MSIAFKVPQTSLSSFVSVKVCILCFWPHQNSNDLCLQGLADVWIPRNRLISRRQITGRANCASQRGEIYLLLALCLASSSSGSIAVALHQRWPDSREHSRSRVHRKVDFPSANYCGNCARQLREIYSTRSLMGPWGDPALLPCCLACMSSGSITLTAALHWRWRWADTWSVALHCAQVDFQSTNYHGDCNSALKYIQNQLIFGLKITEATVPGQAQGKYIASLNLL